MTLQIIKSIDGQNEYALVPINIYYQFQKTLEQACSAEDYLTFDPEDYIENPIALARIKANLTQAQLAKILQVSQAYISKIERQNKISAKLMHRVKLALEKTYEQAQKKKTHK